MTFLVVAAALIAFIMLVWNLIDKIRAARKPHDDMKDWRRDTDEKLRSDKEHLDALEDGQRVFLRAMNALISHEINGNSTDKLKEAQQEILNYLIDK